MLLISIISIIFQVIEIGSNAESDDKMLRCYKCDGSRKVKPDCEETCNATAKGACYVSIQNGTVFQGCFVYSFALEDIRACIWQNAGLLGLSKLTTSTKNLCTICQEDMCNEFAKMPRDDLSAYDKLLPNVSTTHKCYECDSRNLKHCNRHTNFCLKESLTCYSLYQNGVYKQGCRFKDFLDDFECEKIENSTKTTKEFCRTCNTELEDDCCNDIKPEELEATTKKHVRRKSTPEKDVPEKTATEKNMPEENEMGRKVTQDQPSKSSATKSAVPTFFFYLIWSSTYLLLILIG